MPLQLFIIPKVKPFTFSLLTTQQIPKFSKPRLCVLNFESYQINLKKEGILTYREANANFLHKYAKRMHKLMENVDLVES